MYSVDSSNDANNSAKDRSVGLIHISLEKLQNFIHAGVFIAVVGAVLGYFGKYHYIVDLFSHFRLLYAFVIGVGLMLAAATRRRKLALIWATGFLVNVVAIVPLMIPVTGQVQENGQKVRVLFVNVFRNNPKREAVVELIRSSHPEVVIAVEVDYDWTDRLIKDLGPNWPYFKQADRDDNFGILIMSRLPLKEAEVFESPGTYVPSIRAEVDVKGESVVIYGTHPFPPLSKFNYENQRKHMDDIARRVLLEESPVVLMGDFNSTPWSVNYRDFIKKCGLVDTMQGFGPQASWPNWLPVIGLPIDHILVSPGVVTQKRRLGAAVGSDHRPVIADLVIPVKK